MGPVHHVGDFTRATSVTIEHLPGSVSPFYVRWYNARHLERTMSMTKEDARELFNWLGVRLLK